MTNTTISNFIFDGALAEIACAELGFRPEVRFVGVHVTDGGHIVICGSAGHREEFRALENAVSKRGWHWNHVDTRRPRASTVDAAEMFELDRELVEMTTGKTASNADVLKYRAGEAVKAQREAERRHEIDAQMLAMAPAA